MNDEKTSQMFLLFNAKKKKKQQRKKYIYELIAWRNQLTTLRK